MVKPLRKWPPPPPSPLPRPQPQENKSIKMSEKLSLKSKRNLWVKIYCEALKSPVCGKSWSGPDVREFATNCANHAVEEVSKIG